MIGYCAQLPHQRKHVGIEPHVEERCWFDLLPPAMRSRLVEHRGHAGEELHENGHGSLVHGDRHEMRPLCWRTKRGNLASFGGAITLTEVGRVFSVRTDGQD